MKITRPPVKANAANAMPAAARTASSFWNFGAASDVGDAELADPVALPIVMDAVEDEVVDALVNVFSFVMVAVNPVTFLQPDPIELFAPVTKLTAAH